MKRIVSLVMALVCLAGCLSGCKKEEDIAQAVPTYSTGAMGRYVETSISLPEGKYVQDLVMLNDGRLRLSMTNEDGTGTVYTSGTDRKTWEGRWNVPEEILATGRVSILALSPTGSVFCHTWQDAQEKREYHFWVIQQDGSFAEIPITCPDLDDQTGFLVSNCDFTDEGKLFAAFQLTQVRQIDLTTGEVGEDINGLQGPILKMGCAGEDVYIAGWDAVSGWVNGEMAALDNVMGQQLTDSLKATEGNTPKFSFWRNSQGYLFYTTHEGLFSYIPGGSITEELVSGARSSLGDPTFLPVALTGTEDDTFYILGSRSGGENVLLHYAYDAEVPTVSDTQLRIFSLYADEDLPQMISQYQVAHPEVMVDLEIGMTGEDGITQADAVRTLNTEILAGNGPDLICLDGFNLDAYLEKGMLADVSGILAQAEPTLTQITGCYEQNGKICAVPTSFQLPAMYGPEHIVSQIHDWDSLVTAVEQLKTERTDIRGVLGAFQPIAMADQFYDTCSSHWQDPDGTISEEKLADFYAGLQRVWDLDAELQVTWAGRLYEEPTFAPGEYIGLLGSTLMTPGDYCISFGTLNGMRAWSNVLAADSELDNYITAPLALYGSGIFIPKGIMGILSTSQHPQAAGEFLKFMLSETVQAKDLVYSFPVNQAVFQKETGEDRVLDSFISDSDENGNYVSWQEQWPDAEDRERLRAWVAGLTTPASQDRTIRNLIMDQMYPCLLDEITAQEAAKTALRSLNLYLAE